MSSMCGLRRFCARPKVFAVLIMVALFAGCDDSAAAASHDVESDSGPGALRDAEAKVFDIIRYSEGGKCLRNGDGCTRSWIVTSDGTVHYQTTAGIDHSALNAEQRRGISEVVSDPEFVRALSAGECSGGGPDLHVTITLELEGRLYQDQEARGCVLDGYEQHPYYRLRKLMKQIAASHFDAGAI